MVDPKIAMEVPPQVREFAVKSVEQAEQAISKFMEFGQQINRPSAFSDERYCETSPYDH